MKAVVLAEKLGSIPEAQYGFFTRSQAIDAGLADWSLHNAVNRRAIHRVGTGVYRVAGSGFIPFEELWIAWLRVVDVLNPRERVLRPEVWVSHQSAAVIHGYGDFIADTHHFTTEHRHRPRPGMQFHLRSDGIPRDDWESKDGFALTTIERTCADLLRSGTDGGHVGRFIQEALHVNATTVADVMDATQLTRNQVEAIVNQ